MSGNRSGTHISGARKAAILMIIIGQEAASSIYRNLNEEQVQMITRELAELKAVAPGLAKQVMEEYHQLSLTQEYVSQGGIEYASELLVKAFGSEPAKALLDKVIRAQELSASNLDSLKKVDAQQLAKFLEEEHPQTIALILAHVDTHQASALLTKLPEAIRGEAVKRLAQLKQFSPEITEKVSVVLNRRIQSLDQQSNRTYSGFQSVADLMNRLDTDTARSVLESIEKDEPQLAIEIRNLMFTFEDFVGVPEQSLQVLLTSIDKKTLALALKGASDELKNHVFRAMTSRAGQMLTEDIEALGPVRAKEIAKAKQEAVAIARRLEAEGKLVLNTEGDDEYIL